MTAIEKLTDPSPAAVAEISPNIIHNRFDLTCGGNWDLYKVDGLTVPVTLENGTLRPGLYLADLGAERLRDFSERLFRDYPAARAIRLYYTYTRYPGFEELPHWHIDLPDSEETFLVSLGVNTRRNLRRVLRESGKKFKSVEYAFCRDQAEKEAAVAFFLSIKAVTHGFAWDGTAAEYLEKKGVTDVCILRFDGTLVAVHFICETEASSWYLENGAYDRAFAEYSPGLLLLFHIVGKAIRDGRRKLYLLGGSYEYKQNFRGVLTRTFSGWIYRNPVLGNRTERAGAMLSKFDVSMKLKKRIARLYGRILLDRFHTKVLMQRIKPARPLKNSY